MSRRRIAPWALTAPARPAATLQPREDANRKCEKSLTLPWGRTRHNDDRSLALAAAPNLAIFIKKNDRPSPL